MPWRGAHHRDGPAPSCRPASCIAVFQAHALGLAAQLQTAIHKQTSTQQRTFTNGRPPTTPQPMRMRLLGLGPPGRALSTEHVECE
ncbi:hypothetical protein L227DRAFT_242416 [Lentinus tigrinus ALCF2SS1-6]|uniref:Uncharacterized protein n=1 Tax=Lentinus tigrinus ALCF2SS1-6 TaxID=1328759 RepID=A0A5C2S0M1_9APHY|nr:hypothetical protein L227DRAFT_242416 [Lentinus tigrinus ALCF2SS1-6]